MDGISERVARIVEGREPLIVDAERQRQASADRVLADLLLESKSSPRADLRARSLSLLDSLDSDLEREQQ